MDTLVGHDIHVTFLDKDGSYHNYANGILLSVSPQGIKLTRDSTGLEPLWYPMIRIASMEHSVGCCLVCYKGNQKGE